MKIKSNPYVFPFTPFLDLSNKNFYLKKLGRREIDFREIKELINRNLRLSISVKGETIEEKILNIFLNPEIRFGPKQYILSLKDYWLNKIRYFTKKNEPLRFSILGFPFKIPVPLKTNRILPDLGEIIALKRLFDIQFLIRQFYQPGAVIYVVTEEVFYKFNDMKKNEVNNYQNFLRKIVKIMGWDNVIKFISLHEMEKLANNFKDLFQEKKDYLERLFINGDKKFLKQYYGAHSSIYYITNTRRFGLGEKELMDVYNKDYKKRNKKILLVKELIKNYSHLMIIKYLAYLKLRDDLNFFEKKLPNVIQLSVSPKKYRLGIIPLKKNIVRLPYHGVLVYDKEKNKFTIEYLIDLKRKKWKVWEIYLKEDEEDKPFFYIKE